MVNLANRQGYAGEVRRGRFDCCWERIGDASEIWSDGVVNFDGTSADGIVPLPGVSIGFNVRP